METKATKDELTAIHRGRILQYRVDAAVLSLQIEDLQASTAPNREAVDTRIEELATQLRDTKGKVERSAQWLANNGMDSDEDSQS